MNILVLGAGGMAGHVVATHLSEKGYNVTTLSASHKLNEHTVLLDVTDIASLNNFLNNNSFDVVINCIGILIKQSELRKDLAVYLNSYLPHFLEHFYTNSSTRVIHLSTDCVFSGKNAPYHENSPYDGEIFYDRSKALGEINNSKDLTFRMSIIGPDMNPEGVGLFNWFCAQTGEISGYKNVIWNGITTIELAKAIEKVIDQRDVVGLYHLVPDTNISKYELLRLFKSTFDRNDISVSAETSTASDKTLINNRDDFTHTVPTYERMLSEMKTWIDGHKKLYEHYL